MLRYWSKQRIAWILVALLVLPASITGVILPEIYSGVATSELMAGTVAQDLQSIAMSLLLLFLALTTKAEHTRRQTLGIGILGYLVYAYGIYAFERYYNALYFLYLAILTLSTYCFIGAMVTFRKENIGTNRIGKGLRITQIALLIFIPMMFNLLWGSMLLNYMATGDRIDYYYSIFVIDLSFIMPGMLFLAYHLWKRHRMAYVFSSVLLFLGFAILLPVGLGELMKPLYGHPIDIGGLAMYLSLSLLFLSVSLMGIWSIDHRSPREQGGAHD
jgi:hypothetical protein